MKLQFLLIIALLKAGLTLIAQEAPVIKGRVVDSSNNEGIPFANVVMYNSEGHHINGTPTDFEGYFKIVRFQESASLKASYLGFDVEVLLDDKNSGDLDLGDLFIAINYQSEILNCYYPEIPIDFTEPESKTVYDREWIERSPHR